VLLTLTKSHPEYLQTLKRDRINPRLHIYSRFSASKNWSSWTPFVLICANRWLSLTLTVRNTRRESFKVVPLCILVLLDPRTAGDCPAAVDAPAQLACARLCILIELGSLALVVVADPCWFAGMLVVSICWLMAAVRLKYFLSSNRASFGTIHVGICSHRSSPQF
jgi:hypothetical protein